MALITSIPVVVLPLISCSRKARYNPSRPSGSSSRQAALFPEAISVHRSSGSGRSASGSRGASFGWGSVAVRLAWTGAGGKTNIPNHAQRSTLSRTSRIQTALL